MSTFQTLDRRDHGTLTVERRDKSKMNAMFRAGFHHADTALAILFKGGGQAEIEEW